MLREEHFTRQRKNKLLNKVMEDILLKKEMGRGHNKAVNDNKDCLLKMFDDVKIIKTEQFSKTMDKDGDIVLENIVGVRDNILENTVDTRDNVPDTVLDNTVCIKDNMLDNTVGISHIVLANVNIRDNMLGNMVDIRDNVLKNTVDINDNVLENAFNIKSNVLKFTVDNQGYFIKNTMGMRNTVDDRDNVLKKVIVIRDNVIENTVSNKKTGDVKDNLEKEVIMDINELEKTVNMELNLIETKEEKRRSRDWRTWLQDPGPPDPRPVPVR
jgi:hypothetical protein